MKKYLYIVFSIILMAILAGCSSRIYDESTNEPAIVFSINMSDASPKLLAMVDEFRVTVVAVKDNQTVANNFPLIFNDSTFRVEGLIDSLPAEVELRFTAEALDAQVGVIFRGSTTATLAADIINDIQIDMFPVPPLMKSTPRYQKIFGGDLGTHTIDIKIFNVDSLYGVSFRLYYDPAYILFTGARLDTSQIPSNVIFFENDTFDSTGFYKAITISQTVPNTPIVGSDSDAVLTNIDFTLEQTFITAETTYINIVPTGLTHANQTTIPPSIIYSDETVVEITP